jgi:CBS-domain-containing membrane protein
MRPDWLQAATDATRRNDHRKVLAGAVAGVGAGVAIGGMQWLSVTSHYPLVIIPFAISIVLVIGSREVEPAQPRALIGGRKTRIPKGHRAITAWRSRFGSVAQTGRRRG